MAVVASAVEPLTFGYKPVPAPAAPAPAYLPAPAPTYKPAPAAPAPAPAYHPAPAPAYHPAPAPVYKDEAPAYAYNYGVHSSDSLSYFGGHEADQSHSETRDGYKTSGEYRVALPDGRTQIVTYHADETGYNADASGI